MEVKIISPKYGEKIVLIDNEDYEKFQEYKWYLKYDKTIDNFYVYGKNKKQSKILHRFIMDCPAELVVDHIDRNPLNNQKHNLRICTRQQNAMNKSPYRNKTKTKYKGVYTVTSSKNRYQAQINYQGKYLYLGIFTNQEDAARAYNSAALKYYGEFACLNEVF